MHSTTFALNALKADFLKRIIKSQRQINNKCHLGEIFLEVNSIRRKLQKEPVQFKKIEDADYTALHLDNYLEVFPLLCANIVLE